MSLWRGKYRRKPSKNSIYPSKYTKKTISFRKLPIYNKKPMSLRNKGIGFCQQSERSNSYELGLYAFSGTTTASPPSALSFNSIGSFFPVRFMV